MRGQTGVGGGDKRGWGGDTQGEQARATEADRAREEKT